MENCIHGDSWRYNKLFGKKGGLVFDSASEKDGDSRVFGVLGGISFYHYLIKKSYVVVYFFHFIYHH
ncbi:hypothetical protein HanIR_Chr15g0774111 [Helianthus annuus]|nr:hypothetical protein HanIR_Chr15g0774111 [Helianthus annuus]